MEAMPEKERLPASAARPDALNLVGVTKRLGRKEVLQGIDLWVGAGEIVALLGASGSGKTTLLRLVASMLTPDAGQLSIGGREAAHLAPEARRLGFVFQDYALWPHLSARDHLNLVMGKPGATQRARADTLLATVGLAGLEEAKPNQLSGGQRQRVALARALAVEPGLILLDEPYSALDPVLRETLRGEVAALLRAEGRAALHVTHDPDEAMTVADRIMVLGGGQVLDDGPPERVYKSPATLGSARALGRLNELPAQVQGGKVKLGDWELGTRELSAWRSPAVLPDGEAVVTLRWEHARAVATQSAVLQATFERDASVRGAPLGRLRLPDGSVVIAQRSSRYAPGERVGLEITNASVFSLNP